MDKQYLIDFETEVKEIYEAGDIKAPVHLSGGNEEQLYRYSKRLIKMIGYSVVGEITTMHYYMVFQEIHLWI